MNIVELVRRIMIIKKMIASSHEYCVSEDKFRELLEDLLGVPASSIRTISRPDRGGGGFVQELHVEIDKVKRIVVVFNSCVESIDLVFRSATESIEFNVYRRA